MKQKIMARTSDMHSALKGDVVLIEISSLFPDVWEVDFLYWESSDAVKTDGFMDDLNSQKFSLEAAMYF